MTDRRDRSSVLERRACSGVRRKGAANKTKTTMTTSSTTRRRMLGKSRQRGYLVEDSRVYCKRAFSGAACYSVSAESARRKRNRTRKTRRSKRRRRRRIGGGGGDGRGREKGEEEADDREEGSAGGGEEGKDPREARRFTRSAYIHRGRPSRPLPSPLPRCNTPRKQHRLSTDER